MKSVLKNRINRKGLKKGYWEEYWDNGQLRVKGSYENGKRDGYWECYYDTE
jgi:antitoxin component YwqK of YwqJK toxin-antitoxin module